MSNYTNTTDWLTMDENTLDWDAVYTHELPRLYNFFLYQTGDVQTAQDLTATTFEQAWKSRQRYRQQQAQVQTWLMGIARHVAAKHFRQHDRRRRIAELFGIGERAISAASLPEIIQQQADQQQLRQLVKHLPQREREIIALKYGAGMTNRAIATLTGLSESNIGTITQRTVQRLRRAWGVENG